MAVKTLRVGPGTLTFGADTDLVQLSSQVLSCAVVPEGDAEDPTEVLSGEFVEGAFTETYNLTGEFYQDLETAAGVTEYTWEHSGQVVPFTFVPSTAKGRSVTGQVQMVATQIGGDVGSNATAEFEYRCIGKPTLGTVTAP